MAYQLQSLQLYKITMLDSFEFQECVRGFLLPFCPFAAESNGKDSVVVPSFYLHYTILIIRSIYNLITPPPLSLSVW